MKHIHFIGICGVAMSALAIAFHKKGYTVTGSDVGFYPPVSTHLEESGISYYAGWHPERVLEPIVAHGAESDLIVIVGNVAGSTNPEWQYVQEHKLTYLSYPEAVAQFFVREHSIVTAGTYGKTTSATLLTWILQKAGFDPSYMFGGLTTDPLPAATITESMWSVLEGDEYKSSRWDNRPKFAHYKPTHLLLTGISWDHVDVYPTEASYFEAFRTLVTSLPTHGLLVANGDDQRVHDLATTYQGKTIFYGKTDASDVQFHDVHQTIDGLTFTITDKGGSYHVKSHLLGEYQASNITGCFSLAKAIGVPSEKIVQAIASFQGIKRRLETRHKGDVTVFDDIAHSPAKAASVLHTLRAFTKGKLVAVFEPNSGNREKNAIPQYTHAFRDADVVVIPRLTKIKIDARKKDVPMDGSVLASIIAETHPQVRYIDDDSTLVTYLTEATQKNDTIVFLGSHGFRGMIEETVQKLQP